MSRGEFGSQRPTPSKPNFGGDSEYERLSKTISNNIQQINNNVNVMQKMVVKLGTYEDAMQVQGRLQKTEKTTKILAGETSSLLKQLAYLEADDPSDQRQRKVQMGRLRDNFFAALNSFQLLQREAAEKERACVSRERATSHSDSILAPSDNSGVAYDHRGQSTNIQIQQEDEVSVELIEERERAIRQLEGDIMDVNEIFRDLGSMIHEQGEMIDNIESHVESAGSHVEDANVQLAKASDYQKASRKKMCCLLVILLVVGGAVGLIIYFVAK